ncbi:MAG: hypothetical protein P8Q92_03095 [Pseudoprimorskyibacter sp.]|nr:hypothetical protein [Pseudoprimorskyibacter sp.]
MSDNTSGKMSWTVAALIGLVAAAILHWALDLSVLLALIGGVIVAYAARELAPRGSSETQTPPVAAPKPVQPTPAPVAAPEPEAPAPAPTPDVRDEPMAEAPADPAPAADEPHEEAQEEGLVKPSTPLAGEAELAGRKGSWRYEP